MEIDFTPAAERDLESIGDWIAADDPRRAVSFVEELRERALALAKWAERFPVAYVASEGVAVRRLNHGRYRIFYRVVARRVEIVRMLHGARSDPA